MYRYILYCTNIFAIVLEVIVLIYMMQGIFRFGPKLRYFLLMLVSPVLVPMQKMVRRSILNTFTIDLSPYVLLIVLVYLEQVCAYLLQ